MTTDPRSTQPINGESAVVIDCDAGQDDAIALLLAVGSPLTNVTPEIVTTVTGNSPGSVTNLNARRVIGFLASVGFDSVPVYEGMERAFLRQNQPYFDRDQVLPGWMPTTEPLAASPRPAVQELASFVRDHPEGGVTICALGPLTNIAMAILLDRHFAQRVRRVIWMGGTIGRGNITPSAEFNAYMDPEAAHIVLTAGLEVLVVPGEIGEQAAVGESFIEELQRSNAPTAACAANLVRAMGNAADHDRYLNVGRPMYDPTVIGLLADQSMFTTVDTHITIDTNDGPSLGATHFDLDGRSGQDANAAVVLGVDAERFHGFMIEALTTPPRSREIR